MNVEVLLPTTVIGLNCTTYVEKFKANDGRMMFEQVSTYRGEVIRSYSRKAKEAAGWVAQALRHAEQHKEDVAHFAKVRAEQKAEKKARAPKATQMGFAF